MSSQSSAAPEAREMTGREIVDFFDRTRITGLASFRSLCNALKSQVMSEAVQAWKASSHGRLAVLDLGCGRGGDLRKWAALRLKSYVGVDASAASIAEASSRHASLVAQGQTSLMARFKVADVTADTLDVPSGSIDVVSSMFFLQFSFASQRAAEHVLDEVARTLKPNGVFCCILPDGDVAHGLLGQLYRGETSFGHFRLRKCPERAEGTTPYGLAYNYSLSTAGWCTEYLVSAPLLAQLLQARGLRPTCEGGYFQGAQQLLSEASDSPTVAVILQGQKCSQADWLTLGFFQVLLARKEASAGAQGEP